VETYIDDVAGDWVADIKGEPVKISGTNGTPSDVTLPGAVMNSSDVVVDTYTPAGKAKYLELTKRGYTDSEASQEMVMGVHFTREIVTFNEFRKKYGDPFATDKTSYGRDNNNQQHSKPKRYVQQNPSHLFK